MAMLPLPRSGGSGDRPSASNGIWNCGWTPRSRGTSTGSPRSFHAPPGPSTSGFTTRPLWRGLTARSRTRLSTCGDPSCTRPHSLPYRAPSSTRSSSRRSAALCGTMTGTAAAASASRSSSACRAQATASSCRQMLRCPRSRPLRAPSSTEWSQAWSQRAQDAREQAQFGAAQDRRARLGRRQAPTHRPARAGSHASGRARDGGRRAPRRAAITNHTATHANDLISGL
jgi:hypothetical protein